MSPAKVCGNCDTLLDTLIFNVLIHHTIAGSIEVFSGEVCKRYIWGIDTLLDKLIYNVCN